MASPNLSQLTGDGSEENLNISQATTNLSEKTALPLQSSVDTAAHGDSRLLRLPAELRNVIYRYVLVQVDPIDIANDGHQEPALLTTCKEIRQEAVTLFYCENEFEIEMIDWNIINFLKWDKILAAALGDGDNFDCARGRTRCVGPSDDPNWANLHHWMKEYYHDNTVLEQTEPSSLCSGEETDVYVVASMFVVLNNMKSKTWEEMEGILKEFRVVLAKVDERWNW